MHTCFTISGYLFFSRLSFAFVMRCIGHLRLFREATIYGLIQVPQRVIR